MHTEKMRAELASLTTQTTQHLHSKRTRKIQMSWVRTRLEARQLSNQQLYVAHTEVVHFGILPC